MVGRVASGALFALLAALPDPAKSEVCPVGGDVDDAGIVVGFADATEVYYFRDGDLVTEINRFPDADQNFWVESWRGVFPVRDGVMRGDAPDRRYYSLSDYGRPLDTLPEPQPGVSWRGEITEVDSRGVKLGRTNLTVKFEGRRPLSIGECEYEAIQIETLFADDEGGFQGTLDYLPELGISIQTAGGELGRLLDFYLPTSISAIAPPKSPAQNND